MTAEEAPPRDIRLFSDGPDGPGIETTDTVLTFPGFDQRTLAGKAALANTVSCHLHRFLQDNGVDTHFVDQKGKQSQAILPTEQIPFDLLLHNTALEGFNTEFGLPTDHRFEEPLLEFFVRPDATEGQPVRVSDRHLIALQIATLDELSLIQDIALRINDLLTGAFFGIGVRLDELHMEFGVHFIEEGFPPVVMLISELSPDTLKLTDAKTGKPFDLRAAFNGTRDPLVGYKTITRRFDLDAPKKVVKRAAKVAAKS